MRRSGLGLAILLIVAVLAVGHTGGAHLRLALEDRADPNPRQMALGLELAGACVGIVVSWTER